MNGFKHYWRQYLPEPIPRWYLSIIMTAERLQYLLLDTIHHPPTVAGLVKGELAGIAALSMDPMSSTLAWEAHLQPLLNQLPAITPRARLQICGVVSWATVWQQQVSALSPRQRLIQLQQQASLGLSTAATDCRFDYLALTPNKLSLFAWRQVDIKPIED